MTRVLIALDGSDLDATLASTAHRLFGDDADYWAVNVQAGVDDVSAASMAMPLGYGGAYPYVMPGIYSMRERDAEEQSLMDAADERSRRTADESGLDATVVSAIGAPDEAILRAAELHEVDVIVAGTHDRSWWSKLLQPSVSAGVLADSTVPVLLVKAGGSH